MSTTPKYDYIHRVYNSREEECSYVEWLNQYGEEGWELVQTYYTNLNDQGLISFCKVIFKKQIFDK